MLISLKQVKMNIIDIWACQLNGTLTSPTLLFKLSPSAVEVNKSKAFFSNWSRQPNFKAKFVRLSTQSNKWLTKVGRCFGEPLSHIPRSYLSRNSMIIHFTFRNHTLDKGKQTRQRGESLSVRLCTLKPMKSRFQSLLATNRQRFGILSGFPKLLWGACQANTHRCPLSSLSKPPHPVSTS